MTVHVKASADEVRMALDNLPQRMKQDRRVMDALLTKLGLVALGNIEEAFIVKSRGGTDAAGDRWQPLSPKTIAYSKTRQRGRGGRTAAQKKRPKHPSQALTDRQRNRWWEMYRRGLARFKGDKASAAKFAWGVLKREGVKTLLEMHGNRKVEILRDTGMLLNSLSPGLENPEHQVFRVGQSHVIVGTNRKGASAHHHGVPGRLPQRRLWPHPSKWPAAWWSDLADEVSKGIQDYVNYILRN